MVQVPISKKLWARCCRFLPVNNKPPIETNLNTFCLPKKSQGRPWEILALAAPQTTVPSTECDRSVPSVRRRGGSCISLRMNQFHTIAYWLQWCMCKVLAMIWLVRHQLLEAIQRRAQRPGLGLGFSKSALFLLFIINFVWIKKLRGNNHVKIQKDVFPIQPP